MNISKIKFPITKTTTLATLLACSTISYAQSKYATSNMDNDAITLKDTTPSQIDKTADCVLQQLSKPFYLSLCDYSKIISGEYFRNSYSNSVRIPYRYNDEKVNLKELIVPSGTIDEGVLSNAPSPVVEVQGQKKIASIVVKLDENVLYQYDKDGNPIIAYLIASGKKSTPTHKGLRIVSHIEKYPYKSAPENTKRRQNPGAYGPRIICLNEIDAETGKITPTGEFIHGNCNPASLGKYSSHGCIRMDNKVILELSKQVKSGDFVLIL